MKDCSFFMERKPALQNGEFISESGKDIMFLNGMVFFQRTVLI